MLSLFNYIKGVGAEAPLNLEVVQAHLDLIVQLAELPNHKVEIRQTVTQQLTVMVTKKLRQAGATCLVRGDNPAAVCVVTVWILLSAANTVTRERHDIER